MSPPMRTMRHSILLYTLSLRTFHLNPTELLSH